MKSQQMYKSKVKSKKANNNSVENSQGSKPRNRQVTVERKIYIDGMGKEIKQQFLNTAILRKGS